MVTAVTERPRHEPGEGRAPYGETEIRRWVRGSADEIAANRDFLTQLDAAIGDADHGINMDRGFSAAVTDLDATSDLPAGELLIRVGGTLIYRVGGAAGPLFGTCLRRAGESLRRRRSASTREDLLRALRAGLDGIQKLGAAQEGDKTIVDAYAPAARRVRTRASARAATPPRRRRRRPTRRARACARPCRCRRARAGLPTSGPRSVGHQDPGATSTAYLFAALARALDGER